MACLYPVQAWRSADLNKNGKREPVFRQDLAWQACRGFLLPCGNCIPCRLKVSRDWAFRMMCEGFDYDNHRNCSFVTLTYNSDSIGSGSLVLEDIQGFLKRLRDGLNYHHNVKIRVFYCGEYGSLNFRCHWHLIIFGWNFPDREFFKTLPNGSIIYRSSFLEKYWTFGHSAVCDVSFETCAYVARYVTKKVKGDLADVHYMRPDLETGEIIRYLPEFHNMSRNGGIGFAWLKRNFNCIYPKDYMTFGDGRKWQPPKAFDSKFKEWFPDVFDEIKLKRIESFQYREEMDSFQLEQVAKYWEQQLSKLPRLLE